MLAVWVAMGTVVAFYAYVAVRAVAVRPRAVAPAAATSDLADEPPAVVNLLVERNLDASRAASATLLDLAARRHIEIIQTADDAGHTLVKLRGPRPSRLTAYEQRVLDRVERVAADRAVPVSDLVQRYAEGGYGWNRQLVREVRLDARRRGLIARSDRDVAYVAMGAAAVAVAALLAPLVVRASTDMGGVFCLAVGWAILSLVGWLVLFVPVGRDDPDRYTKRGQRATAHWLGVAAWLRAHPTLRDLPPGAVAVWDRYLAYGVALDVLPHAARVLDFESVGVRDELWSHHTGRPRLVRVRYLSRNRLLRPLGPVAAGASLTWALVTLPVWVVVGAVALASDAWVDYLRYPLLLLAGVQAARAAYRLVRSAVDLRFPISVTGTVVDIGVAARNPSADYANAQRPIGDFTTYYYFVVDDGSTDVLRPWLVNRDVAGDPRPGTFDPDAGWPGADQAWSGNAGGFRPGDAVRIEGQRWSRYARRLTAVSPRPAGTDSQPADA
jgi:hypothetical protein